MNANSRWLFQEKKLEEIAKETAKLTRDRVAKFEHIQNSIGLAHSRLSEIDDASPPDSTHDGMSLGLVIGVVISAWAAYSKEFNLSNTITYVASGAGLGWIIGVIHDAIVSANRSRLKARLQNEIDQLKELRRNP